MQSRVLRARLQIHIRYQCQRLLGEACRRLCSASAVSWHVLNDLSSVWAACRHVLLALLQTHLHCHFQRCFTGAGCRYYIGYAACM